MNLEKIVGDNVRGYREKLGYSQEELAYEAEVHRTYIGTVERAEQSMSLKNLGKLAKALKIEPHLLLIKESYKR